MNDQIPFHTPSFGDEEFDIPLMHTTTAHQVDNFQMPVNMNLLSNDASSYNQWNHTMPQEPQMTHNAASYEIEPLNHSNYQQQMMMLQHNNTNSQQMQNRNSPQVFTTPPPLEANGSTSDDSEDNANSLKRSDIYKTESPSVSTKAVPNKKAKPAKKKKKKDPNEPQKPVSAYALFFRDTQAAIKGQNPNASFGEVSKIVASMWDVLAPEHKSVYKKKTEAAKKEYLKLLAAYKASVISQGNESELQSTQNKPTSQFVTQQVTPKIFSPSSQAQQQLIHSNPHQNNYQQQQSAPQMSAHIPQPHQNYQQIPTSYQPGFNKSPQQSAMQMNMNQMMHHQQQQNIQAMNGMVNMTQPPQQQFINQQQMNMSDQQQMMNSQQPQQFHNQQLPEASSQPTTLQPLQYCIRNGCTNVSVASSDWEDEFCSNDCVVVHCRDVFGNWVHNNRSNNPQQSFSVVK